MASRVKAKDIELWIHGLGVEPQTRNNYRTILSGLFSYELKHGFVNENPIAKIEKVYPVQSRSYSFEIITS